MVGHTCAPSFLLNLPSAFCYLLLPNKLPQHLVAWGSDFLFSQLWVGRSPLGLAGLTPVAALSSRWGREGWESLTPMLRVSVLAVLLHVASHPPGGQIWLLHSAMASGFPELWRQSCQASEGLGQNWRNSTSATFFGLKQKSRVTIFKGRGNRPTLYWKEQQNHIAKTRGVFSNDPLYPALFALKNKTPLLETFVKWFLREHSEYGMAGLGTDALVSACCKALEESVCIVELGMAASKECGHPPSWFTGAAS